MTDQATIFVRFTIPGFHMWAGAPDIRDYLSYKHRHLFHVEVRMKVAHDDREVEFHDLLDEARRIFNQLDIGGDDVQASTANFGTQSCEMLARALGEWLATQYKRSVTVIVSEDGECGAEIVAPF